jgi:hypothetical protein
MPLVLSGSNGISTNGTTWALQPDSTGQVNLPNQPIISGQMGTAMTSPTGAQKLAFDQFWVNRGGISYNSSTRRFTVPTTGIYRIAFNPFFNTGQSAARVLIGVNTDTPSVNDAHFGHAYRESATYDTACIDSTVSLISGDYIVFYLSSGGLYNQSTDRFNQFSITKIA